MGGKGINVSMYLNHQQSQHHLFCLMGEGPWSDLIASELDRQQHTMLHRGSMKQDNRICTTVIHEKLVQEWISPSPIISDHEEIDIIESLDHLMKREEFDRILLCGSWPSEVNQLFSLLIKFKNAGGELIVDSFQQFDTWLEMDAFPSVWKLNKSEWALVHRKIPSSMISDCIRIITSERVNEMTLKESNRVIQTKVPLVDSPKNTIGAGDLWLAAIIYRLNDQAFWLYSDPDLDEAMRWANHAAAQRVQRHSFWHF